MPANIRGVKPAQGDMLPVTLFSMEPMGGPSKASADRSQTASPRAHAGPWLTKVERGFADNQWSYLLMMRLFPVIPFFIANLIPAFLGIRLPVFVITTFVGIIPATAIFATVGAGLGSVLESSTELSLHSLVTPQVELALAGLALLAAAPIVVKYLRRRRASRDR